LEFELDSKVYDKEALIKCLYWYSEEYEISISRIDEVYRVCITPFESNTATVSKSKLLREVMDYQLRQIVKKETTSIRELIMAKAFSNGEFDEEPKGDLMDPLGIKFL
jgi:His-Xaa-Ser system protein HxsD